MSDERIVISRTKISKAGITLIDNSASEKDKAKALEIINQWRGNHTYPVNTFNVTLRTRVKKISKDSLVAQRLKRVPSIEKKLLKNKSMQLARMQDIGGLRAIVENLQQVRKLESLYKEGKLTHTLDAVDDYISQPKPSGYRSLHLIYKYNNTKNNSYNGYSIEIQIRTKLQHAWATAVETIGSFLDQALKASEGSKEWLEYFKYVSAAFAISEKSPVLSEMEHLTEYEILKKCIELEKRLDVREKLQAFSVAAKAINSDESKGRYQLVVLDTSKRNVSITSYSKRRLNEANIAYAEAEKLALEDTAIQVVLVATDSAESLKRAYPNYFLDTKEFVKQLNKLEKSYVNFGEAVLNR
jgi:putative GTP pyrophosphokinase